MSVEKIRPLLTLLSALTLLLSFLCKNRTTALVLLAIYIPAALVLYYSNLRRLAGIAASGQSKSVRMAAVFMALLVVAIVVFAILVSRGKISAMEPLGKWMMTLICCLLILSFGSVAAKLPYKAPMGLRVPWTLSDSEAWVIAHRVLNEISIPTSILCFASIPVFPRVEIWLLGILLVWLVIPLAVSHTFLIRKWRGKI